MPDAYVPPPPPPTYDLGCLNRQPVSAPSSVTMGGRLFDVTSFTAQGNVPATEMRTYRVDNDELLGMGMSTESSTYSYTLALGGVPRQAYTDFAPTGFVPTRMTYTLATSASQADLSMGAIQASRLDALAAALGATIDPAKAVLEIWLYDCKISEMPQATITVAGAPDAAWAMLEGAGTWVPRATTVAAPTGFPLSVAATVNLPPGAHMISVSTPIGDLGPYPVTLAAGHWNVLQVTPGLPTL